MLTRNRELNRGLRRELTALRMQVDLLIKANWGAETALSQVGGELMRAAWDASVDWEPNGSDLIHTIREADRILHSSRQELLNARIKAMTDHEDFLAKLHRVRS